MTAKEELQTLVAAMSDEEADEALRLLRSLDGVPRSRTATDADEDEESAEAILARARPFTFDDPLWEIVGIIDDPSLPTDMAENHDKYLADAYADLHEE